MKQVLILASLIILLSTTQIFADKYDTKSFKMEVSGTSTLHNWEAPAKKLTAKGDFNIVNNQLIGINGLTVDVEAKSIKSEKESMDDKIYECIKADDHKSITYKFTKVNSMTQNGNEWTINATGSLFIGGTSLQIEMIVKAKLLPSGDIEFSGVKTIKLSQFKLERPSAMLGTIKCGDDITLTFSLLMKKA